MPDSFFSSNKPRKRKRVLTSHVAPSSSKPGLSKNAHKPKRKRVDEELPSDATDDENNGGIDDMDLRPDEDPGMSADEDEDETPAQKRLRLAQLYIQSVKEGLESNDYDAAEIDKELISSRLRQDVLEHAGKVHLFIADTLELSQLPKSILKTRGHRFSVTSAVASSSKPYLFTAGKEASIIKWDLSTGKRLHIFHKQKSASTSKGKARQDDSVVGHTDEVLALALSDDGHILASAGKDRVLTIWDAEKNERLKGFVGPLTHKDTITALSFRKHSRQLFTASMDRTIKVYDLSPSVMGYVETLFGHQDQVIDLHSLRGETCVSVGARDKTVRFWKVADESQLVFRGGGRSRVREVIEGELRADEDTAETKVSTSKYAEGSLECTAMIDESTFLSGGDSGSISLWSTSKKKPIFTQSFAHGFDEVHSADGLLQTPRWVASLGTLHYSDLFASGSWSGEIRLWKLDPKLKSFSLVGSIPALGVINSLQLFSPTAEFAKACSWVSDDEKGDKSKPPIWLVAGLGKEPRLGRWLNIKTEGAHNSALVVALPYKP